MTIETARTRLAEMACAIQALDGVLEELAGALPRSPDREAMFESKRPYDVPTELVAVTETVREDYLAPAARALARASRIDDRRLAARFRQARAALDAISATTPSQERASSRIPTEDPPKHPRHST